MKKVCLIASYGGSGSTFLDNQLKKILSNQYLFYHVHGVPDEKRLGIPVFNKYTGHGEGPFSRSIDLESSAKIILIYRDPAEAYRSRASFKHFLHIWSDTDVMNKVFGTEGPEKTTFQKTWKEKSSKSEDILHISEYFFRWRKYAKSGKHDIAFVKYEELDKGWAEILDFLESPANKIAPLKDFSAKKRKIESDVENIFSGLRDEMRKYPSVELFKSNHKNELDDRESKQITEFKGQFVCKSVRAGFSDALTRIALCYDVIKSNFDADFIFPEYNNYHSPDTDWYELFSINREYVQKNPKINEGLPIIELNASELIYEVLHNPESLSKNCQYHITPDIYPNDWRVSRLKRFGLYKEKFYSNISYQTDVNPFSKSGSKKIVCHLRRQDICGGILLDEEDRKNLPEKILKGLHTRPLLTIERCIQEIEKITDPGDDIEVVIVSDGFKRLQSKFRKWPKILSRIDEMEKELETPVSLSDRQISVVRRIIGTGTDETRATLDAMACADVIYTASSAFPKFIARIAKVQLIPVKVS